MLARYRKTYQNIVQVIIAFGYTRSDRISAEKEKTFNAFMEEHKEDCGVIGDFAGNHITKHPDILMNDWNSIAREVLTLLYELARQQAPAWLWDKIEDNPLDNLTENRISQIKAASLAMINTAWERNRYELMNKEEQEISFSEKIQKLAGHDMLPHIRLHMVEGVCLQSSFVAELKKTYRINRISMKQLADLIGGEYKTVRLCGGKGIWVVCIPLKQFVAFLTDRSEQMELKTWQQRAAGSATGV